MASLPNFGANSTADEVLGSSDLTGKVAIITGGNSGIGLEVARSLLKGGATVYIACRDKIRGGDAVEHLTETTGNGRIYFLHLNLSSLKSVMEFVDNWKSVVKSPLHYLINNAGTTRRNLALTEDNFDVVIATNHLGHFVLTYQLLDVLKASAPSRVITLSSNYHSATSKVSWSSPFFTSGGWGTGSAYSLSKLFNMWHASELHRRMSRFGVFSFSVHPGLVNTEILRDLPCCIRQITKLGKTPEQGAATVLFAALWADPTQEGGEYYADCHIAKKSKLGRNSVEAARCWDESLELVGLDPDQATLWLNAEPRRLKSIFKRDRATVGKNISSGKSKKQRKRTKKVKTVHEIGETSKSESS